MEKETEKVEVSVEELNRLFHRVENSIHLGLGSGASPGQIIVVHSEPMGISIRGIVEAIDAASEGGSTCKIKLDLPEPKGRFVITGGPGFGKSELIDEVGRRGITVFREAALKILRRNIDKFSDAIRTGDRERFDEELRSIMYEDYYSHQTASLAFYDRGFPDFIGWNAYYNKEEATALADVYSHPYERIVFLTKPWPEIFRETMERPFSYEEACRINDAIDHGYRKCGYVVRYLENEDTNLRAEHVLNAVTHYMNGGRGE